MRLVLGCKQRPIPLRISLRHEVQVGLQAILTQRHGFIFIDVYFERVLRQSPTHITNRDRQQTCKQHDAYRITD